MRPIRPIRAFDVGVPRTAQGGRACQALVGGPVASILSVVEMGGPSERELRAGRRKLAQHRPREALVSLRAAVEKAPPGADAVLARALYYLGVALARLGETESAIRSWLLSHRMRQGPYAVRMIERYTNGYGMARQRRGELDDWRAFLAIQLERYLSRKKRGHFSSSAERDMVRDLLLDAWASLRRAVILEEMDPLAKRRLFEDMDVVFPMERRGRTSETSPETGVITVDFRRGRRAQATDPCPCGSGLRFMSCCGRLPDVRELLGGSL